MRLLAAVLGSRRRLLSGGTVTLAAATVAGFAFVSPGYPTADVHLNDGGVWVTNAGELMVGRLNHQIEELDSALTAAGNDVDVVQEESNVFAVNPSRGTMQQIDPAFVSLGTDIRIPAGGKVGLGGGLVTVLDPASGRLWIRSADQIGALNIDGQKPDLSLGGGAAVAVGPTGTVAAVSTAQHRLTVVAPTGETRTAALPHDLKRATVTLVGDQPVVLDADGGRLITGDGATHGLGDAKDAQLQQPGPAADGVLVATDDALLDVPLGGGSPSRLAPGAGSPIAPVRVGGCAHAAWTAKPTYAESCPGKALFSAPIPKAAPGAQLRFRVNRDVVVLNDLQTGDVWPLDKDMTLVHNWDQVRPPDPQNASDQKPDAFDDAQRLHRTDQNHPPVARPNKYGVRPGLPTLLPVLNNDSDPDGDVLVIDKIEGLDTGRGAVSIVDDSRQLQFTPAAGTTGVVGFSYTVDDGRGGTASAQVTVEIHPFSENSPPVQVRKTRTVVVQGGTVTQRVLSDWIDPDGDELSLVGASLKTADTVRFTADGAVTYIDSGTEPGKRAVDLAVSDGKAVAHGTLNVQVRPPGELPPTARADHVVTFVKQTATVSPLVNDTDPNQDELRLTGIDAPPAVHVVPDYLHGTFTVTSATAGTYYLTYTVVDGPDSAQAVVRVDVLAGGTNTPPVAVRDLAFVPSAGSTTVDVLANDVDADGDVLVVTGVSSSAPDLSVSVRDHRFLTIAATGLLAGPETVDYTVSDGTATANGRVIVRSIPPSPHNQPPVAQPDTATVRAGDVLTLDVLANDSDPDGDPLTLQPKLPEPASAGSITVIGNKLHVLAPAQAGTVRAIYAVADSTGQTASSLVTIYVRPADGHNSPPTPPTVTARAIAGSVARIDIPLSGTDPDGDSVQVVDIGTAPTKGRISEIGPDHLMYQAYDQTGTDTFTYVVEDRFGARGTGTIRVGIAPRPTGNQPPVAQDDTVTTRPGRTVSVDVRANDSDPDGDAVLFAAHPFTETGGAHPELVGGRVQVVAPDSGQLTIGYAITDGRGGTATGYLTVTADPHAPLQPPVAVDDIVPLDQLVPGRFVPIEVLANDYDPDGSAKDLTVALAAPTANARVDAAGRVLVRGTPSPQTIAYTVKDVDGQTATALVLVPAAGNLPPRLKAGLGDIVVTSAGKSWPLSDLVEDPEGHAVVLTGSLITATNSDGSPLATDKTTLRFVPARNYSGPASLSFEVTDGTGADDPHGVKALLTLPITVKGDGNQPPKFAGASLSVAPGEDAKTLDLAPLATDPNNDRLQFKLPSSIPAGFDVSLDGSVLKVAAKDSAKEGTLGRLDLTVSDGHNPPQPAPVDLRVIGSSRPLARAVADTAQADQGSSVTVDVLANDANPFPGSPLKIMNAQVMSGQAAASIDGNKVTVRPGGDFVGTVTVQYTVRDKTGEPSRDVQGLLTVTVRGRPGQPVAPSVLETRDSTVVLSWPAPIANGAPILDYRVHAAGVDQTCPTTTCTITGLTNGTTYTFTLTARNAVGESPASPPSAPAKPDNQPDPPAAPTLTFGDGTMGVAWVPPHNTGSAITHYEVEISPGGAAVSVTGTSYTFTGLTNGQSYQVRVRAFNGAPSPSDWSAYSAPEIPAGVPAQPAPPTASLVQGPLGGQIDVSWTQPDSNGAAIDTYTLQVLKNGVLERTLTYPGGTTSDRLSEANANDYTFTVSATNKAGTSDVSGPSSSVHPFSEPAAVGPVNAAPGNGQATLTFSPPNDGGKPIGSYFVQWNGASQTFTGSDTTTSITVPGLANGSSYSFTVAACNDNCGSPSPQSNAVTPYGPPTAPPSVGSSPNYKTMTFSWAAASANGSPINHYEVSIDGGGWQNVGMATSTGPIGNAYNQGHNIAVRAVDNAGEAGPSNGASGSTGAASIEITKGGSAQGQPGCSSSACAYIVVTIHGFAANNYTFTPDSSSGNGGFYPYTVHSDGNYGTKVTGDYFGTPGGWVSVTIDGVRGQTTW